MSVPEIVAVVRKWRDVYIAEGEFLRGSGSPEGYVQIFEVSSARRGRETEPPLTRADARTAAL